MQGERGAAEKPEILSRNPMNVIEYFLGICVNIIITHPLNPKESIPISTLTMVFLYL